MPELKSIPTPQHVNLDNVSIEELSKTLKPILAVNLVISTFNRYDSTERSTLYERWAEADRLYSGWKEPKVWEGSTVARANFPYRTVFDQVEAAIPAIREALFGAGDWFDVTALPGGDKEAAKATKARLRYVLGQQFKGYGPSAVSEIMAAVQGALIYGQGCLGIQFNPTSKLPEVMNLDLRDMYFDLGNNTPWVDNCRSVIQRSRKTVEELMKWRGAPNIELPDDDTLWSLAQHTQFTTGDASKDEKRAIIGESSTVAMDKIPNPRHGLVEVLTYYSEERIITVLGRSIVIYNEKNPYGCIPFCVIPCYAYPNRFMAQSYADILYEIQRVTEALINGRLDEISLTLNPPRAKSSRGMMTPSQEAWRPGAVYDFNMDAKDSMVILNQQAIATNVWNEIEFYRTAGELRTGLNGLAQGSARPGNVNRTAGGISTQMQASALRLSTLVWNTETFGIVPMLAKVLKFLQAHEAPGDYAAAQTDEGYGYVPTSSYYKPVTFVVKASSSMLSRERLQQALPMILQTFSNGPMVQGLSAAKMTVNWPRIGELIQEAAGTSETYDLVIPMDEQQIAAMQQPPPQVQAMLQKSQMDTQRALQLKQMDGQNALQLEAAKSQGSPMELQAEQQKMALEAQMAQFKIEIEQTKLALEKEKAAIKAQSERMKMESQAQKAQLDSFLAQHKAQTDVQLGQQKAAVQQTQLAQEQEASEAEHEFGMRSMSERSALEQKLNKNKLDTSMSLSQQRLQASREKPQGRKASKPKE